MFGAQWFSVLTQGEPGYGVKGDKGDTGASGPQVSDAESLEIKQDVTLILISSNCREHKASRVHRALRGLWVFPEQRERR